MKQQFRYHSVNVLINKVQDYSERAERLEKLARKGGSLKNETKWMAEYYKNSASECSKLLRFA